MEIIHNQFFQDTIPSKIENYPKPVLSRPPHLPKVEIIKKSVLSRLPYTIRVENQSLQVATSSQSRSYQK